MKQKLLNTELVFILQLSEFESNRSLLKIRRFSLKGRVLRLESNNFFMNFCVVFEENPDSA